MTLPTQIVDLIIFILHIINDDGFFIKHKIYAYIIEIRFIVLYLLQ